MPYSVAWVREMAAGCTRCTSPIAVRRDVMAVGVSFPSGAGTVRRREPLKRSSAPHSSTSMWACSLQITPCQGASTVERPSTLAAVPFTVKNTSPPPRSALSLAATLVVRGSSP